MRSSLRIGGVLLVLGMLVFVGKSGSVPKPQAQHTRTALINLAQVFKGSERVIAYAAENKKMLLPFSEKAKAVQTQIEGLNKELEDKELPADKRDELEKKLRAYTRQMEDLSKDAKSLYTKKNEEQMLVVYKEVHEAVQRYAKTHEIDLVMHFNDVPSDQPEFFNPVNVSRKIQAGACIPMYMVSGLEITKDIVTDLNDRYQAEKEKVKAGGE